MFAHLFFGETLLVKILLDYKIEELLCLFLIYSLLLIICCTAPLIRKDQNYIQEGLKLLFSIFLLCHFVSLVDCNIYFRYIKLRLYSILINIFHNHVYSLHFYFLSKKVPTTAENIPAYNISIIKSVFHLNPINDNAIRPFHLSTFT